MHRKCTENGPNGGPTGGPRQGSEPRPWPRTARRSPFKPLRALRARGPAPQEGPREPQEAQNCAQDGPQRPKIGSKRPSEGWTEQVRTKMRKSASRLGGSVIFDGRTAPKNDPNRPNLALKSAQKANWTEDSTSAAEHSARRPEIRPRTADSRLEEGSQLTANQIGSEVRTHISGQSRIRSSPSIHPSIH